MQTINKVATTIEIKSKIKALEGDIRRFNLLFEKMYREDAKTFVWLKKRYLDGCSVGEIADEVGAYLLADIAHIVGFSNCMTITLKGGEVMTYEEQRQLAFTLNTRSSGIQNEEVLKLYRQLTDVELLNKVKKALKNRGFQYMKEVEEHFDSVTKKNIRSFRRP